MKRSSIEISVGIFMFIGLVCVGYLTIHLGQVDWFGEDYYTVYARFASVSGLKAGAGVEIAGVKVGEIETISLDTKVQTAKVKLKIRKGITLTDDVIASIKTTGLIGDKYVMLSPGGSDRVLEEGDLITETEPAIDLESLISKYVFGSAE